MFSEIEVKGRNHNDDGPTDGISENESARE
jgi:hypothetical protein